MGVPDPELGMHGQFAQGIDRSGEANPPKLSRWASPQSWARKPDTGVAARSAAIIAAAPP